MNSSQSAKAPQIIKVVYFDEESASDLLDMSEGGRLITSKDVTGETEVQARAEAKARIAAKLEWIPFIGGSTDLSAAASASAVGKNILNKTLSNTILTDYLEKLDGLVGVKRIADVAVIAYEDSAAYMKMYTPYLAMLKFSEDEPVNLNALDSALEIAKGYYELIGKHADGTKCILRFNLESFRNSYRLIDLGRMKLVFHGIRVGTAVETSLTMESEMSQGAPTPLDATDIVDGGSVNSKEPQLDVYDVILAGVEYAD